MIARTDEKLLDWLYSRTGSGDSEIICAAFGSFKARGTISRDEIRTAIKNAADTNMLDVMEKLILLYSPHIERS